MPSLDLKDERTVVSAHGISVGIHLAEPVQFLQGFQNLKNAPWNATVLRGSLHIRVQEAAWIKTMTLNFTGRATTRWPGGIPPQRKHFEETDTIMSHTWRFFNAQFDSAEKSTNADHVQLSNGWDGVSTKNNRAEPLDRSLPNAPAVNVRYKAAKQLALSLDQARN